MSDPGRKLDIKSSVVTMIPALRAYALSLTRDKAEADELVHDALLNAMTLNQRFWSDIDPRAWLFINMRRSFYADGKVPKKENHVRVVRPWRKELETAQDWTGRIKSEDLLVAILRLPVPFRETLMLIIVLGESYETCALITNCEPRTVKSRMEWGVPRIIAELEVMRT